MVATKLRPVGFDPQTDPDRLSWVHKLRVAVSAGDSKGGAVNARLCRRILSRRGQEPSRSTTKVTQVHPARIGCCC
jgi:hypothetical protein